MPPGPFATIFRYASFILVVFVAINLAYGRARAQALVTAGRITQEELDNFIRGAALLLGGFFLLAGVLQLLDSAPDPFCLMTFPPQAAFGWAFWVAQGFLSGWIVWWLWARDGGRILAALAPAFTRGPVLQRTLSPRWVRLGVTALAVLAPIGNVIVQLTTPELRGCAAG